MNKNNANENLITEINMDKMNEKELDELIKQAKNKKKEIKEIKIQKEKESARKNIEWLRIHKEFLLELIPHSCSSCSKYNNGIYYETVDDKTYLKYRCSRCALKEILEGQWGTDFDISFDIDIREIK